MMWTTPTLWKVAATLTATLLAGTAWLAHSIGRQSGVQSTQSAWNLEKATQLQAQLLEQTKRRMAEQELVDAQESHAAELDAIRVDRAADRRAAEAALYLERAPADEPEPMPQAIEPERPMTSSTINRASVAAGGTATLVAANETIYAARELKSGASDLGDWLVPVLLIAVVGLCAFIAWERIKIRREGWS